MTYTITAGIINILNELFTLGPIFQSSDKQFDNTYIEKGR